MNKITSIKAILNNRLQFTLQMKLRDILDYIRSGMIAVNNDAQRSIHPTTKMSTTEIIESDALGRSTRIKAFGDFINHQILEKLENDPSSSPTAGFFGTLQMVVSHNTGNVQFEKTIYPDKTTLSYSVGELVDTLENDDQEVGILKFNPEPAEALLYIVDGQGRVLVWFHYEKDLSAQIIKLKKRIMLLDSKGSSVVDEKDKLSGLEKRQNTLRGYLANFSLSITLTSDSMDEAGVLKGLSLEHQRQAYIEGNQLNNQASVEEALEFDGTKNILSLLRDMRTFINEDIPPKRVFPWLSEEVVESTRKSISPGSLKIHTISGISQSLCRSATGKSNALRITHKDDELVKERDKFVIKFWRLITTDAFGEHWYPEHCRDDQTLFGDYLRERREARDAVFQGVFLQGIGKLGFSLGKRLDWDPDKLDSIDFTQLKPIARLGSTSRFDYDLWDPKEKKWNNDIKKLAVEKPDKTGSISYTFQNTSTNIENAFVMLEARLSSVKPTSPEVENTSSYPG
jgi:hypothetical protein